MTPFADFYASAAQQPILLWCAATVGLLIAGLPRTSRSTRIFCLVFGLLPFLDAWLTADRVLGVGALSPTAGVVVATFFVVVGDLRVLLFLSSATAEGEIALTGAGTARSVLLSLIVPTATAAFRSLLPDAPWRGQATFLFYEVSFVGLLLALRAGRWGATRFPWGRSVTRYVLGYYALWALADVAILFVHLDAGYLLRVVPTVLYYGGLLAVVSLTAPPASPAHALAQGTGPAGASR